MPEQVATPAMVDAAQDEDAWIDVRDSWVGEATPPPPVTVLVPAAGLPADGEPGRERVREVLMDAALKALAVSDYEGALMAAEAVVRFSQFDVDGRQCAQIARKELERIYEARLGSRSSLLRVLDSRAAAAGHASNTPAGAVLRMIDGVSTLGDVIDRSDMPEVRVLKILSELYLRGLIWVEPGA
jgi:hypothetical protein